MCGRAIRAAGGVVLSLALALATASAAGGAVAYLHATFATRRAVARLESALRAVPERLELVELRLNRLEALSYRIAAAVGARLGPEAITRSEAAEPP